MWESRTFTVVDPCAGEGDAVLGLVHAAFDEKDLRGHVAVYAAEMEATRAKRLGKRREEAGCKLPYGGLEAAHGDAFRIPVEEPFASLVYLNPPYDLDPVHGRLEERWTRRWVRALLERGVLVLVVPGYALRASAETLARELDDVRCWRFPDADYAAFKQVVLLGTKRSGLLEPDAALVARIEAWAANPAALPELPESGPAVATLPPDGKRHKAWRPAPLDVVALRERFRPWHASDRAGRLRPIAGVVPDRPVADLLIRTYPLAMPPRPAHIAAGVAAGLFNGARIEPDDPTRGLPELLVKGAFDREFVTVDERTNKDGEKTGEVQVQQPKLVVTVLDLHERRYCTLAPSADRTGAERVEDMTTADLLDAYGRALMRTMLDHCPVLHDPTRAEDAIPLPVLPRTLYRAQAHATMAAVKLLGGLEASRESRRGRAVFLLGEIGSGKSSVALATAKAIGARRVLVMCPPHLLDSWREQAAACVPEAPVRVLASVADLDAFAAEPTPGLVLAVMSREAAKLGHAWTSVGPACPRCGAEVPTGDLAKTRARCSAQALRPRNSAARRALELALLLLPCSPTSPLVGQFFRGRHGRRLVAALAARAPDPEAAWAARRGRARRTVLKLLDRLLEPTEGGGLSDTLGNVLLRVLAAVNDARLTETVVEEVFEASLDDLESYGRGSQLRAWARKALLLLEPGGDAQVRLLTRLRAHPAETRPAWKYGENDPWRETDEAIKALAGGCAPPAWQLREHAPTEAGARAYEGAALGSVTAALAALEALAKVGSWSFGEECGEPLYCAVPEPRRVPLATYLTRRHPRLLDLFVLDEGHEYAGDGSAQSFAAHRITGLGVPTVLLTGSVMNGYAESLFANQWALDPEFRDEFARGQRQEFIRRYGYLKQLVEDRDKESGKAVEFGSHSDRVERSTRTIGSAPGVLPLFVLRYLLRRAVTIHKADLALDLPKCLEEACPVAPSPELLTRFNRLRDALMQAIRRDRFVEGRAGKLWGQMAELPSYLDRATADVGNVPGGDYVIAYPEAIGEVVTSERGLSAATVLPKERWMLDRVRAELAEGRRCLVFAWHTALLPRLQRLLQAELGEPVPLLDAGKVAAAKRQAWIDKEVIARGRRVLVVNPIAVQTGLNNLVHFSTEVWMQNPGCNAIAYRQAVGRVDRIGQQRETRILFPVYEGTAQEQLHRLLLHKVAVSMSTDGLDAASALAAAGVGSGGFDAMAVGRQLYELLEAEAERARAPA